MSDEQRDVPNRILTKTPEMRPIEEVVPYENNPRKIPQTAVDAVAESIRMFGWQQPIVVDREGVIVVGHTRRLAALQRGDTHVPVIVMDLPEERVREYRLVDNRTSEMSDWNYDSLVIELREFDQSLLDTFFSDVSLEVSRIEKSTAPSEQEIQWAADEARKVNEPAAEAQHTTSVTCPSCFYAFQVRTKSLPGMDPSTMSEITGGGPK